MSSFHRSLFVVLFFVVAALFSQSASAQSTLISLTTRRGMVFDKAGLHLYVSTSNGTVKVFNASNGALIKAYTVGTSLNGIDIAADDSFVLVAENSAGSSQGTFYRINLSNGHVTNVPYNLASGEGGAWDVAIGSNGVALVTTQYQGTQWFVPLRQINLTTNAVTWRIDDPGSGGNGLVWQDARIVRSADRTRMYLLETGLSPGPFFTYNATTNTFGAAAELGTNSVPAGVAVNRNGTILGTRVDNFPYIGASNASLDSAADYSYIHSHSGLTAGVAFDAVKDIFYAVGNGGTQVIAFDTNTFKELFRFNIGETVSEGLTQFDAGTLVASPDGQHLALTTASGIRLFNVSTNVPGPAPTFAGLAGMVFDHSGKYLYASTSDGYVWPYNLITRKLETPYTFGGSLVGLDIAPDDSFLIAGQGVPGIVQGAFQKMDLHNGALTNLTYTCERSEAGGWAVALMSNGTAFGTTRLAGSGWTPLRQINLATGTVNTRTDAPGSGLFGEVRDASQIRRSADRTRLYILESDEDAGPMFTYSAVTDTFGPVGDTLRFNDSASAAVNRTGSLLASQSANHASSLYNAPPFNLVHSFSDIDSGLAFDAVRDRFYGVNSSTSQIVGYNTNTFAQEVVLQLLTFVDPGASMFGSGTLVASQDGRYLALQNQFSSFLVYLFPPNSGPIPQVATFTRLSNGHVIIQAFATPNTTNSVRESSSLTGTFTTIGSALADGNGFIQYEDGLGAGGSGPRFYKITSP